MNTHFPAELAVHLADSVHAARRRYRKRLARCQEKFSEKAVHELRVETRRMLALLDLLALLRFPDSLKKLRKVFKCRLDAFDELRDTQVQRGLLKPLWHRFPGAKPFKAFLRCREKKLVMKLACAINATKHARMNRRLKQMEKCLIRCAGDPAPAASTALAVAALGQAFQRVLGLRRPVRRSDPETIHRLRVAFKRFRYLSELLQPLQPWLTPQRCERMKEYQTLAGEIQDLEVLLTRLAAMVRDGELRVSQTKHLQTELLRRRRRAIDSFMAAIDDVFNFEPELPSGGR